MLTQSAPAIVNALSGVLPDNAMRALVQALGNCNQPLAHRGSVSLSPGKRSEAGPGFVNGNAWNPQSYESLLPTQESADGVDVPGWDSPGGWGSSNYYGDNFDFRTNSEFSINNYNGGPNFYNAGDQYVDNSYSNTVNSQTTNTTNLNVTNINGVPIQGPGGPAGRKGERGERGERGRGRDYVLLTGQQQLSFLSGQATATLDPPGLQFLEFTTTDIQTYTGEGCVDDECKITLTPGPLVTVVTGLQKVGAVEIAGLQTSKAYPLTAARLLAIN
jgi:hypothetical protein